jgi:hypothetical protein
MKGPSQNRLAPLTHQSKHPGVLAQNIIPSKMIAIRFGHRTHRSRRAHKALYRTLSPVTTRGGFLERDEACASISRGTMSGLMKQFIRTLGDASS